MIDIPDNRSTELRHHIDLGRQWLDASNGGTQTTLLSYAAFEFRFAIERLTVHYWLQLAGDDPQHGSVRTLRSFKRLEKKIYELAGNQLRINRSYELTRCFFEILGLEIHFPTPSVGKLAEHWHSCSELCHIAWTLFSEVEGNSDHAFKELTEIHDYLIDQVSGITGWPMVPDSGCPEYVLLAERFMSGEAGVEDVKEYIKRKGIWAKVEYQDERPSHFLGTPAPPESN